MRIGSLRLRLLLGATAFLLAAMAIAAAGLSVLFERHVKSWIDDELNAVVDQLIAGVDIEGSGAFRIKDPPTDPRFAAPLSGHYWQVTFEGSERVLRSRSLWDGLIALPQQTTPIGDHSHHHSVEGPGRQTLYVLERRVELPVRLGRKTARFAVGVNEADVSAAVWNFTAALAPFLLVLGGLLVAATWIQVSLGLRPLNSIRDRIAGIRSGQEKRLGGDFPEEVLPLAHEIDTLLDARDRQIETARTRAADLAHGLKTPIQVLIGGIAKLQARGEQEIAGDFEVAAATMQRHVERQLAKARLAANGGSVSTDARKIAEQVANVVRKTPGGAALDWSVAIPAGVMLAIHPDDLAEALGGLMENAARHARTRVEVSAVAEAGQVTVRVADDGPGIAEEHFDDVLGRGRRLDTSAPGSGLGLAIVADIAEAWGGTIGFSRDRELFSADLRLRSSQPAR